MKVSKAGIFFISLLLIMFSSVVRAQNFNYIYIQTEKPASFYIKMGEQTLISSSLGYLIIPKLTDDSYKIRMGFPQTALPELLFTVVLNQTDKGYLLKTDSDQGVYMVDLQTKKSIPIERQWPAIKSGNVVKRNDAFTRILSEVMDDSTIMEVPVFVRSEPALQLSQPAMEPSVKTIEVAMKTSIDQASNLSPQKDSGNATLLSIADTANKLSPATLSKTNKATKKSSAVNKKKTEMGKSIAVTTENDLVQNSKPSSTRSSNINPAINQKDEIAIKKDSPVITKPNIALAKNNCKKIATQSDFLKLRKKMAVDETEADIQKIATIQFGNTCFTTAQIKELGALFVTEEGRYKFYVFAFSHVSDKDGYSILQNQFTNNYYITRFNAMIQR